MIMKKDGKLFLIISVSFFAVLLDQLAKFVLSKNLELHQSIELLPFLKITLIHNTGAAFGLFNGFQLVSILVALIIIIAVIYYFDRIPKKDRLFQTSIALILGGTLGNLIDRLIFRYVIDFIDFGFWPAFNIADSAISIGAILLIVCLFWRNKK